MRTALLEDLDQRLHELDDAGLRKSERLLASPQRAEIELASGQRVVNLCANDYLGLASHPALIEAAHAALDAYGYGMASVRFICGTHVVHRALEERLTAFLGTEDTLLYSSCFDANGGLFEALLDAEDAILSDALNHASIIDGVRLCKARRYRYANGDLGELERCLVDAADARHRLIVTDGVFSMDGVLADLPGICALAERHRATVVVDDSHAVGVLGENGRGTPEATGVADRVDFVTGTLGKALGGASGGYVSGRREGIAWLRQRSRPYLFSNSLMPVVAATALRALELLAASRELRERLMHNAARFRAALSAAGFTLTGAGHPIVPVMLGDAQRAATMATRLLERGVYVVGFSYPVVPLGRARIRAQLSAAHTDEHLERAVAAFTEVGRELGVIP